MKLFHQVFNKVQQTLEDKVILTQIAPQIYHCPYPDIPASFRHIPRDIKAQRVQIWNLSEYKYAQQTKKALQAYGYEVMELNYQYYCNLPLTTAIVHTEFLSRYIKQSQGNYALIHCQQNRSRSIVFLAVYGYLMEGYEDIATALAAVSGKFNPNTHKNSSLINSITGSLMPKPSNNPTLRSGDEFKLLASQHSILRNITNYHHDPTCININHLKLLKVIINQAPKTPQVTLGQQQSLKVLMQIRGDDKIVYHSLTEQFGQSQIMKFDIAKDKCQPSITHKEQPSSSQPSPDETHCNDVDSLILHDDCLFSFKYVFNRKVYPIMRIQLNTNFIYNNFIRVPMQEIEMAGNTQASGFVFTDFIFECVDDRYSELSSLKSLESINRNVELIDQSNRQKHETKDNRTQADNQCAQKGMKIYREPTNKVSEQSMDSKEGRQLGQDENVFDINEDDDNMGSQDKLNKMLMKLKVKEKMQQQFEDQMKRQMQQQQQENEIMAENGQQPSTVTGDEQHGDAEGQQHKCVDKEQSVQQNKENEGNQSAEQISHQQQNPYDETSTKTDQQIKERQQEKQVQTRENPTNIQTQQQTQLPKQQSSQSSQAQVDMDDYLSKLEQQA